MIVIKNKFIPFGDYDTINLFGIIFTKKDVTEKIINHEKIHTAQLIEVTIISAIIIVAFIQLFNASYWWILTAPLIYYTWYCVEYMRISIMHDKQLCSYLDISFEEEAHANDDNLDYIFKRKPFAWFKYIKSESNHKSDKNCCN